MYKMRKWENAKDKNAKVTVKINERYTSTGVSSSAYLRVTLAYVVVRPNLQQ